eukprot:1561279-Prymnesium_polylepis.1
MPVVAAADLASTIADAQSRLACGRTSRPEPSDHACMTPCAAQRMTPPDLVVLLSPGLVSGPRTPARGTPPPQTSSAAHAAIGRRL